jgi:L-asparagine transporter-like permease
MSNTLHSAGAVFGFGCMVLWVMLCFTKSDKHKNMQTKEKQRRDTCYFWLGASMLLSLLIFVINFIGLLGDDFPVVFAAECLMLTFGGVACLIKGGLIFGLIFKDKHEDR